MKTKTRTRSKARPPCNIITFPRTAKQLLANYHSEKSSDVVRGLRSQKFNLSELEVCAEIASRNGLKVGEVVEELLRSALRAYADGPASSWNGRIGESLPWLLQGAVRARLEGGSDQWPPSFTLNHPAEA